MVWTFRHCTVYRVCFIHNVYGIRTNSRRALSNNFAEANLNVYVTGDAPDVYEESLLKAARAGTDQFHPTLLLVGTRLGIERITPAYREALKAALQMPQSVGIAGYAIVETRGAVCT